MEVIKQLYRYYYVAKRLCPHLEETAGFWLLDSVSSYNPEELKDVITRNVKSRFGERCPNMCNFLAEDSFYNEKGFCIRKEKVCTYKLPETINLLLKYTDLYCWLLKQVDLEKRIFQGIENAEDYKINGDTAIFLDSVNDLDSAWTQLDKIAVKTREEKELMRAAKKINTLLTEGLEKYKVHKRARRYYILNPFYPIIFTSELTEIESKILYYSMTYMGIQEKAIYEWFGESMVLRDYNKDKFYWKPKLRPVLSFKEIESIT